MKTIGIVYQDVRISYLFDEAESMGYKILLINNKINHEFDHKSIIAKEELNIYSENAYSKLLSLVKKYKLNGLVTIYDRAIPLVAQVNFALGLIGIEKEIAPNFRSKSIMKKCFKMHNVSTAKSYEVDLRNDIDFKAILDKFNEFPLIVKPSEGYGGDKVCLSYNLDELIKYLENINLSGEYKSALIEEFIGGEEYIVDSFSHNGKHNILSIAYKGVPTGPYFEEPFHLAGNVVSQKNREKIVIEVSKALDALGIKNGPSHTEIKIFNEKIYIIEIGARIGGEGICHFLVKESTGINFVNILFKWIVGENIDKELDIIPAPSKYALNYNIRVNNGGILKEISGLNNLKNNNKVFNLIVISNEGDILKPYPNFTGYPGFINSIHVDFNEAENFIKYLDANIVAKFY